MMTLFPLNNHLKPGVARHPVGSPSTVEYDCVVPDAIVQDLLGMPFGPDAQGIHGLGQGRAERGERVVDPGRDAGRLVTGDKSVTLHGPQGVGEHLGSDAYTSLEPDQYILEKTSHQKPLLK